MPSHPQNFSRDDGGAAVEAAIALPALVVLLLCTLQLALLQQARLLTEYAAFCAARVGIVRSADNGASQGAFDGPMREAAAIAVLPTMGRTDGWASLAAARARFALAQAALRPLGLDLLRVAVLHPTRGLFGKFGGHLHGEEIDFDDVRPDAARATLLSVQVRYLFELRVPFANRLLQGIWLATKVGPGASLALWRGWNLAAPRLSLGAGGGTDAVTAANALAAGVVVQDGMPGGLPLTGLVAAARLGHYYLPVGAWTTQRLQSNPFLDAAAP